MHMQLINDCFKIFEDKDLNSIGELEQTLATGVNEFGKSVDNKKLLGQIGSRLESIKL